MVKVVKNSANKSDKKIKVFMSAKSDIIFKLLFGNELNKDLLVKFLMAVLKLPLDEYTDIQITDPQSKRRYKGDKLAILDIKVKTATGKTVNIEIQIDVPPEMRERILLYDAKMITEQIKSGDNYDVIKKVISIVITGEVFISEHNKYHDRFILYSPETNTELTDLIEIHTLELPKLTKASDGTALWNWMEFIKAESELNMLAQKSPEMKAPIEKLLEINQDPTARMLYEAREKQRRDMMSRERKASRDGERKGRIKDARKMLAKNMSIDDIMDITELSREEILALNKAD